MNGQGTKLSIKRRQLLIAGIVAAATPPGVFAAQCGGGVVAAAENPFGAAAGGGKLVVSGRVLGFGCQPLSGAVIEAWQEGMAPVRTIADGDGRFLLTTEVPVSLRGEAPHLTYHVTHPAHDLRARELFFSRQSSGSSESVASLERDEAGVWRAAFGVTLV